MSQTLSRPAIASDAPWPAVDDHLLVNGSTFELFDGEEIPVVPADPAHSAAHSDLIALLRSHAAPGFSVGVDLMTRVAARSEVAPDACLYATAPDKEGHRQLEELAFEVLATEQRSHAARKARLLTARGVRRVFAIDVGWSQVLEWDTARNDWRLLVPGSEIEDRCLVRPLAVNALRGAVEVSHEELEAWVKKQHPVLLREQATALHEGKLAGLKEGKQAGLKEGKLAGLEEGEAKGLREAVSDLCELLGIALTEAQREQLAGLDLAGLQRLRAHLKATRSWPAG
jgi:hypothetical protein